MVTVLDRPPDVHQEGPVAQQLAQGPGLGVGHIGPGHQVCPHSSGPGRGRRAGRFPRLAEAMALDTRGRARVTSSPWSARTS